MPLLTRTISIKLNPSAEQGDMLSRTQVAYAEACNTAVPHAIEHRCWNKVALHHHCYYDIRGKIALGSQMTCQAIRQVAEAYKALKVKPDADMPTICFDHASVRYDHRTYRLKESIVSLYTVDGRVLIPLESGQFQRDYLERGKAKEARLIHRKGAWYFNLVLDIESEKTPRGESICAVDVGENNLATLSTGKIFKGDQLRHERDKYLHLRKRLQANGSKSAKQLLRKASGREQRHVRQVNHDISKQIVQEAIANDCGVVVMEKLTNIRKRIRAKKRVRTRLHRWAWYELQTFVKYKAEAAGLDVIYVNPAYTSKTCSQCGALAHRSKHLLSCKNCGSRQHSDINACQNLCKLGATAVASTGVRNSSVCSSSRS